MIETWTPYWLLQDEYVSLIKKIYKLKIITKTSEMELIEIVNYLFLGNGIFTPKLVDRSRS